MKFPSTASLYSTRCRTYGAFLFLQAYPALPHPTEPKTRSLGTPVALGCHCSALRAGVRVGEKRSQVPQPSQVRLQFAIAAPGAINTDFSSREIFRMGRAVMSGMTRNLTERNVPERVWLATS